MKSSPRLSSLSFQAFAEVVVSINASPPLPKPTSSPE